MARWWRPTVEALARRVVGVLAPLGVQLGEPMYVTASATPVDRVAAEPHLDDDQYHPDAGVGLVAIAASHRGPRLARGVLGCSRATEGGPLGLDPAELVDWFAGDGGSVTRRVQRTPAHRIVLLPRFGQLHAGPTTADGRMASGRIRHLLVLRAETVVPGDPAPVDAQLRSGSGPT